MFHALRAPLQQFFHAIHPPARPHPAAPLAPPPPYSPSAPYPPFTHGLPAPQAGPAASEWFQMMADPASAVPSVPPARMLPPTWAMPPRMPWRANGRVLPPPSADTLEAAQAGHPAAQRHVHERNIKYQDYQNAVPAVASLADLGACTAQAAQQLDYRDRRLPPVMLIGSAAGSSASIEAVGQAAHAMASRGAAGTLLLEFSPAQLPLLGHLEGVARGLIQAQGGYRPGLVDQLTHAYLPVAQQYAAHTGQAPDGQALLLGARTWAVQMLSVQRARDAGFNVIPIGARSDHASIDQHEAHMGAMLQRQQLQNPQQPLIVLTGGLQTNAFLPALAHSNWRAVTATQPEQWMETSERVRRNFHQGVHADPRFQMVMLSPQAAQADPFWRG